MSDKIEFKVGDIVDWCGANGEITGIFDNCDYPLYVKFEKDVCVFTKDGRAYNWHKEPSLKLVSLPKKTKVVYQWYRIGRV